MVEHQISKEPSGNKANCKGGEAEDPDPCSLEKFFNTIAGAAAKAALIASIVALSTAFIALVAVSTVATEFAFGAALVTFIAAIGEGITVLTDSSMNSEQKYNKIENIFNTVSIALAALSLASLACLFNPTPYNPSQNSQKVQEEQKTQVTQSSVKKFNNWEEMKSCYNGKVTEFIKEYKPKGSPDIKKWFTKGNEIIIEEIGDKE